MIRGGLQSQKPIPEGRQKAKSLKTSCLFGFLSFGIARENKCENTTSKRDERDIRLELRRYKTAVESLILTRNRDSRVLFFYTRLQG